MRATLMDASLARYAGRFVWLDLNYDGAPNQTFLERHGVTNTPSFFILDPTDEHATATQFGAMTLSEFAAFLDRGEHNFLASTTTPADDAMTRGDALLASKQHSQAAAAYEEALRLGGTSWSNRDRAATAFAWALMSSKQYQRCADTTAQEAPNLQRGPEFGRLLVAGMLCVNSDSDAPWALPTGNTLVPFAAEAAGLPATARDHRFQLYQNLMYFAESRKEKATVDFWGHCWLQELDATKPASDEERSALDIARVDAASILGNPARVLPALEASEQAMPDNYTASLRLATMQVADKKYADAVAACDRGLKHVTGALGESWLLQIKADALARSGKRAEARSALEDALRAAHRIGVQQARENNINKVSRAIRELNSQGR